MWNLAKEADGPTWIGFEWDSGCKVGFQAATKRAEQRGMLPAWFADGALSSPEMQESNPTCNTALVQGTNALNTIIPRLFNPAKGDMR